MNIKNKLLLFLLVACSLTVATETLSFYSLPISRSTSEYFLKLEKQLMDYSKLQFNAFWFTLKDYFNYPNPTNIPESKEEYISYEYSKNTPLQNNLFYSDEYSKLFDSNYKSENNIFNDVDCSEIKMLFYAGMIDATMNTPEINEEIKEKIFQNQLHMDQLRDYANEKSYEEDLKKYKNNNFAMNALIYCINKHKNDHDDFNVYEIFNSGDSKKIERIEKSLENSPPIMMEAIRYKKANEEMLKQNFEKDVHNFLPNFFEQFTPGFTVATETLSFDNVENTSKENEFKNVDCSEVKHLFGSAFIGASSNTDESDRRTIYEYQLYADLLRKYAHKSNKKESKEDFMMQALIHCINKHQKPSDITIIKTADTEKIKHNFEENIRKVIPGFFHQFESSDEVRDDL